ncbi:MAG: type II toxin-antitoxin system VapC family toxin [Thermoplasmata archaeon]|nr:type II toxin-antitoxin system VapC family toxin [Thermoplasmata archaeon]
MLRPGQARREKSVTIALLDEAMALHLQYDGTLSVADCASVALMSRKGIGGIVSFDSDFDKVRGIRRIH